ncbi:energy-coupled thiamine transporter ThiT [Metabacillus sp. GX 13764]|uniref:energy-coupled thiamine transporter ThiT n=1 Tax=Metabacillus kandeliae TaxID=2900151 RepID=UPI001E3E764E|nr:energy-coupled thiamine transporter ThiT [Metabacillus kandeliae]MCD7035864.1 energy-coupled thiamine transporter ThiT [Metabacillus kandeliae]
MNQRLIFMVETAIFSAIALLLDYFSNILPRLPQGGSLSLAMVPIFLMAFRWGWKGGVLTGFLTGTLQIVLGMASIVHWVQFLLDYSLAYALLGISGLFSSWVISSADSRRKRAVVLSVFTAGLAGSALRYLAHVISGIVFFASYAPKGTPVVPYSLIYNSTYMIPSWIVSCLIVVLLLQTSPALLKRKSELT